MFPYSHSESLLNTGQALGLSTEEDQTQFLLSGSSQGTEGGYTLCLVRQPWSSGETFIREVASPQEGKGQECTWQRQTGVQVGDGGRPCVCCSLSPAMAMVSPRSWTLGWAERRKGGCLSLSPSHKPSGYLCTHLPLPATFLDPRAVTQVRKGKTPGPRTRARGSRANSPVHWLCDFGQGMLWASVSPPIKWQCFSA